MTVWWARPRPSVRPASEGTVEASDCVRRMPPPRGGMSPTLSPSLPFTKDCTALYNEISDTSIESQIHNATLLIRVMLPVCLHKIDCKDGGPPDGLALDHFDSN